MPVRVGVAVGGVPVMVGVGSVPVTVGVAVGGVPVMVGVGVAGRVGLGVTGRVGVGLTVAVGMGAVPSSFSRARVVNGLLE